MFNNVVEGGYVIYPVIRWYSVKSHWEDSSRHYFEHRHCTVSLGTVLHLCADVPPRDPCCSNSHSSDTDLIFRSIVKPFIHFLELLVHLLVQLFHSVVQHPFRRRLAPFAASPTMTSTFCSHVSFVSVNRAHVFQIKKTDFQ